MATDKPTTAAVYLGAVGIRWWMGRDFSAVFISVEPGVLIHKSSMAISWWICHEPVNILLVILLKTFKIGFKFLVMDEAI